MITEVISS